MDAPQPPSPAATSPPPASEARPPVQENWLLDCGGDAPRAFEVPIYTDARITGMVTEGFGPYQFFNPCPPGDDFHVARAAVILRYGLHLKYELPPWDRTNEETYHAGGLADEVAAILSLCLGIRAQAGDVSRAFAPGADPRGLPVAYDGDGRHPALPPAGRRGPLVRSAGGEHSLGQLADFRSLPALPASVALTLVRAARLYQAALWVAEVDPNQCWLLLSSAVETAAGQWSDGASPPAETLRAWHPSLAKLLVKRGGEDLATDVAEKLSKITGATWKFLQFLNRFRPDPPAARPPPFLWFDWDPAPFEAAMRKVYHYRSRALHGGTPFPAPMCWPPTSVGNNPVLAETPAGTSSGTGVHTWVRDDVPLLLHTFEYIVRHALRNWWRSCVPPAAADRDASPGGGATADPA